MKPGSADSLEIIQHLKNRVELLENILKINNIDPAIEQTKKSKELDKLYNNS